MLARQFPGYELRDSQIKFAEAVWKVLHEEKHLIVEAPSGTGKTFAYLIPAIYFARKFDKKAVVCTANKTLQAQLIKKDLPYLKKVLDIDFSYASIKGLNNYLCKKKLYEEIKQPLLIKSIQDYRSQIDEVEEWAEYTEEGDRDEIEFELNPILWQAVNGNPDTCMGRDCEHYRRCFAMLARRRIKNVDIIVCNYHLFFYDIITHGRILPPYDFVVFDEAHNLADICRDCFGMEVSQDSARHLIRGARLLKDEDMEKDIWRHSTAFFSALYREFESAEFPLRVAQPLAEKLLKPFKRLQSIISRYCVELSKEQRVSEEESKRLEKFAKAGENFISRIEEFLQLENPEKVYFLERYGTKVVINSNLINPASVLKEEVFDKVKTAILTSATLAAGGDFDFLKSEVGLEEACEVILDSPFDMSKQAIIVIPRVKSNPISEEFACEISPMINETIQGLNGRTLVLFTSYKNLHFCAQEAEDNTDIQILVQGEGQNPDLLKRFKETEGTALFATYSFWEGIDIPGEVLSCVIIDKLPFMPPDNPLIEAMQEKIGDVFVKFQLPKAIIRLRQAIGRLIRTRTDKGAIVIFDNRFFTKSYGQKVKASLPFARIYKDLGSLFDFLSHLNK